MRNIITAILGVLWMSRIALCAEPRAAVDSILPEDVVQGSVKEVQMESNRFAVFFTYTDIGAKKMLTFSEQHAGQKMRTRVGKYLGPEGVCYEPPDPGEYAKWKEDWLKRRTSKIVGLSDIDTKSILAGLKGEPRK